MGVTRLKRKELRNRSKAKARQKKIKHLTATPVIKNIDIEEIKKEFAAKAASRKQVSKEEKPAAKASKDESVKEDTSREEKATAKASKAETVKKEPAIEEKATAKKSKDESSKEETAKEEEEK